jgi:hypothetical protein
MSKHFVCFPSKHLNCEYIGINAYATDNWEIEITLDGQYHLQDLEKIVAYVKTLNVQKAREKC